MEPQQSTHQAAPRQQNILIPIAIIIGFGMIAAAIFFSGNKQVAISDTAPDATAPVAGDLSQINPVDDKDHILGDPNASIILVEYSDFDCPFCKSYHETMNKIVEEYGAEGKVSWVYRHFPISTRHPNAERVAEASECIAELGGNEAFWKFSDLAFSERDVNEPTNLLRLDEFAEAAGVDKTAFNACLDSGKHKADVQADLENAAAIGANGTPFTVIMVGDQLGTIEGAQPYTVVKGVIENLIGQLNATGQ